MGPHRQQVVVPAERRLRGAEPAVVVGHVAGMLGHPGHGQDVAVVGGVGADEVPPHQDRDHHAVQHGHRPPARRQEPPVPHPVGGVEDVQCDQRDDGQQHAQDHHRHLQRRRSAAVAGVDGGREAQAGRCRSGQVGEDPDDLRPEVVAPAFTFERGAGVVAVGALGQADELGGHLVGVRGEGQLLAGGAEHLGQRRDDDGGVADDDHKVVVGALDQQAPVDGLGRLLGNRGQQDRPAGGLQSLRGTARDADVEVGGDVADQRCGDAVEHTVLWPVQLRGGLLDRHQRSQDRQRGAQQAGDDGDKAGGSIIRPRLVHGGRW